MSNKRKKQESNSTWDNAVFLVEAGESRTLFSGVPSSISKFPDPYQSKPNPINDDPAELFQELLKRLVVLGDIGRKLCLVLNHKGCKSKATKKLIDEIADI